MKTAEIKEILLPLISPELLEQAWAEGLTDEQIFNQRLFIAMTQFNPKLLIKFPWQLGALAGVINFDAPIDWDETDNMGLARSHYIAWSGNLAAMKLVLKHDIYALMRKTSHGYTAGNYAIRSGNPDMLQLLLAQDKSVLDGTDQDGRPATFYAVRSGNPYMLKLVLDQDKHAVTREDSAGRTAVHFAAELGNSAMLQLVIDRDKGALTRTTKQGRTAAHFVAKYGNPAALQLLLERDENALKAIDKDGCGIVHFAAWSGNPDNLELVLKRDKDAITRLDKGGCTALHYAVASGNPAMLRYLFNEYPALTKQAWIRNRTGDMPNALAPENMTPKPNQILDEVLLAATNRVIDHRENSNDLILLDAFKEEWQELLVEENGFNIGALIAQISRFPSPLQNIINNILLPALKIKHFSFKDDLVTRDQLKNLIDLIPHNAQQLKTTIPQALIIFGQQCKEQDSLNAEEQRCLQLISEDYERGLLGPHDLITDLVIRKLTNSTTLSQFRPKPVKTQELNINSENFATYLQTFRDSVRQLALNPEESKDIEEIMLPGLEKLHTEEDAIVAHAVNNFGQLYYLDDAKELPLHTDHTPVADGEEYRKTLHRLIANFFGAAEIAHNAGRLREFCGKITNGLCFEIRVRDTFAWAASFSEVLPFNDLMQRYTEEYSAFAHVMLKQNDAQAIFIEPVCAFIMERHNNTPCVPDTDYAPDGIVTQVGVEKYLENILDYTKQPILEIEMLITSLQEEPGHFWKGSFWSASSKKIIEDQIQVLTELKQVWESALKQEKNPSLETILEVKDKIDEKNWGKFDQRTRNIFDKVETQARDKELERAQIAASRADMAALAAERAKNEADESADLVQKKQDKSDDLPQEEDDEPGDVSQKKEL